MKKNIEENTKLEKTHLEFYGFNSVDKQWYELLNCPELSPYTEVSKNKKGKTKFFDKTFGDIREDIFIALRELRTKSENTICPHRDKLVFILPYKLEPLFQVSIENECTLNSFLMSYFPKIQVIFSKHLDNNFKGHDTFYIFAPEVHGESVFSKNPETQMMIRKPYAFVRYFGI